MSIATQEGATFDNDGGVFDATDAFLKKMGKGAEQLPEDTIEEDDESEQDVPEDTDVTDEETPADDEGDTEEDSEETDEDEDTDEDESEEKPAKRDSDEDDVIVKVKVDGEEHEVSVKDLKRLYGQEKALTRKSQEVADQRKKIDEIGAKQVVALTTMFQRAQERAKPYQAIDFLALAKDQNVSAETLTALRHEAQRAFDDVNFYGQELDKVYNDARAQRADVLKKQAIEAHKVLSDPDKGVPGWSQAVYDDIRQYAISGGIDANVVNELTDPGAIKMLYKAMMFDKGQKALSQTKKVVKTPKKIMKSSSKETITKSKPSKTEATLSALRTSGSVDAATDVFLSRMLG